MAEWDITSLACVKTWIHLKTLDQLNKVFEDSGKVKSKELQFWDDSASGSTRTLQANTLAQQLDSMFRQFDKAKYETGSDLTKAVSAMVSILIDGDKTVADLAQVVETNYHFTGETV